VDRFQPVDYRPDREAILGALADKDVVILAGGPSREREVSFRSALNVQRALHTLGINAPIIDFTDDNVRHLAQNPPDVAVVMMHGRPGEDGVVQGFLESLGVRYTGARLTGSVLGIDKYVFKRFVVAAGIKVPPFFLVKNGEDINNAIDFAKKVGYPVIIKPRAEGSSVGTYVVEGAGELEVKLREDLREFGHTIVEKFIRGKEVTVGVLGTGERSFALPVLALRVKRRRFYDYVAKYTEGETEFVLPAELPEGTYREVQDIARRIHVETECRGFSRTDFIVAEDGTPYVLELNTIPGMTELSDLPAEARHIGLTYEDVVLYILESALI